MAPARISLALALNLLMSTTSGPDQATLEFSVVVGVYLAVGVLHLHHVPVVNEQGGEADGLAQRSAAIGAEVENDRFDALAAEVIENEPHVVRCAVEAGTAAVLGVGVAIEARQIDHADAVGTAVGPLADVEHLALRLAVGQCDFLAGDLIDRLSRTVGGHDFQAHDGVRLAADQCRRRR